MPLQCLIEISYLAQRRSAKNLAMYLIVAWVHLTEHELVQVT